MTEEYVQKMKQICHWAYMCHYIESYDIYIAKLKDRGQLLPLDTQKPVLEQMPAIQKRINSHQIILKEISTIADKLYIASESARLDVPCLFFRDGKRLTIELFPENLGRSNEYWNVKTETYDEDFNESHHTYRYDWYVNAVEGFMLLLPEKKG